MTSRGAIHQADWSGSEQSGLINLLKAIAAQLIILHHLAFYGPMSDHVRPVVPDVIDWLDDHARIAVQVFLVAAGFLAAQSLCQSRSYLVRHPLRMLWRRYMKLVPPFLIATLITIGASTWARLWMTHDSISAPPQLVQLIAHALLVHSILGVESISAGAWYVAIDFQLYAVLLLQLWLAMQMQAMTQCPLPWLMPGLVVALVVASLLHFNPDPAWDVWALYFFGSYGLGALAWWVSEPVQRRAHVGLLLVAMLVPSLAALIIDYRSRIAVALSVACCLALTGRVRLPWLDRLTLVRRLGKASYSIFLIHFAVCLVVNAAFTRYVAGQPRWQAIGMLVAWAASVAAGIGFYRWVERPLNRLLMSSPKDVLTVRPDLERDIT